MNLEQNAPGTGNGHHQPDLLSQLQFSESRYRELNDQLRSLQERFNYVLMATQDAVWDWDLVRNTGWYSDGMKALFGHDALKIADGVTFWYNTIHPDDKDRVVNSIHAVIDNGGTHWNNRYRFRRANGTYAWVYDRGYAIHDRDGKPIRMVGSMQDITDEVNARDALRESEEKFKAIFDQAAVGIFIATPQGEFLSVNNAYPKIFGYTDKELKGKTIFDLSHPDELRHDRKVLGDLLSGQTRIVTREKRYIHKSGKILWGRVFGSVIHDSSNAPKYILGVLEETTDQHAAVDALKEKEERMRLVIDSAKIGTWDFDPQSGVLFWDDRCKAMFGMDPGDHADYDVFLERVHPDDRRAVDEANRNAINGINNGEYDLEYRTMGLRDDKLRWVRAKGRGYKDEKGVPYRYAGTVIDITEEKEREHRLHVQDERFRVLVTSIPQIVWTTDENGVVDYLSEKWELYTGHKHTDGTLSISELVHPDDLLVMNRQWDECMKKGVAYRSEYRLRNIHTGEYRWYNGTTSPLTDHDGKVIKWIGSATDIHDQKMIEKQLESKVIERTKELTDVNQRLERSNSALEQYAFVTSHDLKEPLRKIQIFSDLITTRFSASLPDEARRHLSKIEASRLRMSGLIDDLLKYSRLSDPLSLFDDVDLNTIVQDISIDFEYALEERDIKLEINPLPVVRAVRIQMHQLFFNLFSNAIKFSKPAGPNRIRIESFSLPQEEQAGNPILKASKNYFKIVFRDDGIGFSPQFNEQIFTIFQRLNYREAYEGHGIGLALCRKILDNHEGVITANGMSGQGAEFTIILPHVPDGSQ